MIGSQEIPTRAAPPPAAVLKNRGDQCCSSPARRRMVMPRVIKAGTVMRLAMETGFVSVMETSYSEIVLQPKLDDARVAGGLRVVRPSGSDLPERTAATVAIALDKLKLRVVPRVEELRSEF